MRFWAAPVCTFAAIVSLVCQACRPIPTYQVAHTAHRQEGRDLAGRRGRGRRSFANADRRASAAAAGRARVQDTPWRSLYGPGTSRGGTVPSRLQRPPRLLQAGLGRSWEPGERVVMARPAERRCSSRSNAPEAACHRALLGRARIEHVVARAAAHRRCWVDAMLTLLAVFGLIASGTLHLLLLLLLLALGTTTTPPSLPFFCPHSDCFVCVSE